MNSNALKMREIPKWGNYLRHRWRESFANHLYTEEQEAIYLDSFLWHLCSYEKVNCLEKEQAIEAFNKLTKKKCTIFYQFTNEAFLIENAKALKVSDLPYRDSHMYYSDLYVMDWDYEWTFMMTHEMDSGLGPYFIWNGKKER